MKTQTTRATTTSNFLRASLLALFVFAAVTFSLTTPANANLSVRYGLNNRLIEGVNYFTSLPIGTRQIFQNGTSIYYNRGVYYKKAMYQGRIVYVPTGRWP